ncbi:MAG TPA: NAD-dependent epimerase/dehydratase family protein [Tepidisphaeraceae bacterium]|nr:NAD-dependent epimerase/dehydratase family protein [Tepidisphaeraceae bacterium]
MNVLLIGGTGLISVGIVTHLLARGATVAMLNRGQRRNTLPPTVRQITGDRNDPAVLRDAAAKHFDAVIDMICFTPEQAQADVDAFAGRTKHFIFCSTVCTYGVRVPPRVLVDESFPQEPISGYGRNKVACEQVFLRAHAAGRFPVTIVRPSHTYGPGSPLIDNLEPDAVAWDRIEKGLPVLCAGDGLGLWVSTHRDDCGKVFAHAALNPRTFGQSYNATRDEHLTWREYYRTVASVLGKPARLLFMPTDWITRHDPSRFGLLREITAFHGAYSSDKAKRDVPEFRCEIDLATGAKQTLDDVRRRNAWRSADGDGVYDAMTARALGAGVEPVDA